MKNRKQRARRSVRRKQSKGRYRRTNNKAPRTLRQYLSKSRQFQETWDSVAHVISKMRSGRVSLRKAAREFSVDPDQVITLGRSALRKRNGRYVATKTDRLLRVLTILGSKGKKKIATRDSRQASLFGSHWAAVQRYLQIGDDAHLMKFNDKRVVDASGKRHRLLTNLKELNRFASAGVLSFESMYAGGMR